MNRKMANMPRMTKTPRREMGRAAGKDREIVLHVPRWDAQVYHAIIRPAAPQSAGIVAPPCTATSPVARPGDQHQRRAATSIAARATARRRSPDAESLPRPLRTRRRPDPPLSRERFSKQHQPGQAPPAKADARISASSAATFSTLRSSTAAKPTAPSNSPKPPSV